MADIKAEKYDTDKKEMPQYLRWYEEFFAGLADKPVKVLELGVNKGGSLLMWRDYFQRGRIIGLDINKIELPDDSGRIKCYGGRQDDLALLRRIAEENAPQGFDIIIDDCAHIGAPARKSFWYLFPNHLKPGGIYAIEDWGTGYWDSWPDGRRYAGRDGDPLAGRGFWQKARARLPWLGKPRVKSHDHGMVGFIKELIDECGAEDISNARFGTPPARRSSIERLQISTGIAFVIKRAAEN